MIDKGYVFKVQRFSVNDGPGIRTVIFMKGCHLRCKWCSSPQTWNILPEVIFLKSKCIKCNSCLKVCPQNAVLLKEGGKKIDYDKCTNINCGKCVEVCPTKAIKFDGSLRTVKGVMQQVMKDIKYYQKSGGGVTISGGEPTIQAEFIIEVLKQCKEKGIHTALETSGFTDWLKLKDVLEYVDLIHYDIKHMDAKEHLRLTGKSNGLILDNLQKISKDRADSIVIGFPVTPNCNDTQNNINSLIKLLKKTNINKIDVFPFHKLGQHEYEELGLEYKFSGLEVPSENYLNKIKDFFKQKGIKVV